MADILIKGMEMPKDGDYIFSFAYDDNSEQTICRIAKVNRDGSETLIQYKMLVGLPTHGRLIDADVLMREYEKAQKTMEAHGQEYSCSFLSAGLEISTEWYCVEDMLDSAPTVIEASEGGEQGV